MAETHQQVVKVWIAPGCIVCDACEAECPEVFDVQEETCLIRPAAQSDAFTRPLTPTIIAAAEGCPVDVIKFETVTVEGPEPWAGKEEEAAATTAKASTGGGAKKAGPVIPDGPPDPKWEKILGRAHVSGSRSAGGVSVTLRKPANAPADRVAAAISPDAPPDARDSVMIGSAFTRPRPSVADRIRAKAGSALAIADMTRREFNFVVAGAWAMIIFVFATTGAALQSFMVPKVTKEPPSTFRAGKISDYSEPGVYEQYKPQGVWIVHFEDGTLVAVSTICTHLGCIPNWLITDRKFKCPCHGSGFYMDGVNFEGPAPRPLERFKISIDSGWILVDKSVKYRAELGQWDQAGAFLTV